MLDTCELCPFVDYEKETKTQQYCLIKKEMVDNDKGCDIPSKTIKEFLTERHSNI